MTREMEFIMALQPRNQHAQCRHENPHNTVPVVTPKGELRIPLQLDISIHAMHY